MILRNGDYICIDGSIFSLQGLQSMYISRRKTGIDVQYLDGHHLEIKYTSADVCNEAWNALRKNTTDLVDTNGFVLLYDTMYVRLDGIKHIEYDGVDNRFAVLYKNGECFIFDFQSATITRTMYRKLVEHFFGSDAENAHVAAHTRMRADFWQNVTREINGMVTGERLPNERYWTQIDKSLLSADVWKRGGDR